MIGRGTMESPLSVHSIHGGGGECRFVHYWCLAGFWCMYGSLISFIRVMWRLKRVHNIYIHASALQSVSVWMLTSVWFCVSGRMLTYAFVSFKRRRAASWGVMFCWQSSTTDTIINFCTHFWIATTVRFLSNRCISRGTDGFEVQWVVCSVCVHLVPE